MKKITLLNDNIISIIAAGEIIEYPSCICKELIDNSIDSLAKNIIIDIENGGIDCIKITDDGIGMTFDDAILCFKKHTTSKINNIDDLKNIQTRGFRGEALSSICSISNVEIITKTDNDILGTKIKIFNNNIIDIKKIASSVGTTVIIKDIFKNLPVRKINLRKSNIESSYIYKLILSNALSHKNISFKFIRDKKHIITTNINNKLSNNIDMFYGIDFFKTLIKLKKYNYQNYFIYGYLSNPKYVNKNKNIQHVFINNRIIKSELINKAIKASFENLILSNENPSYFIFIEMPYNKININVTPKKNKVLFLEKEKIFYLINKICIETLNELKKTNNTIDSLVKNINTNIQKKQIENNFLILGEYYGVYLLISYNEQLIIIDKHAAHERLIYDEILKKIKNENLIIKLEFPYKIEMNCLDINTIINNINIFKKIGFNIDLFDENNILIRNIPIFIDKTEIEFVIYNILAIIKKENFIHNYDYQQFIKKIASQLSCKYAIKKNSQYYNINIKIIIDKIINNYLTSHCPHGRPISITINKKNFDKWFKRI